MFFKIQILCFFKIQILCFSKYKFYVFQNINFYVFQNTNFMFLPSQCSKKYPYITLFVEHTSCSFFDSELSYREKLWPTRLVIFVSLSDQSRHNNRAIRQTTISPMCLASQLLYFKEVC